jgi:hypothetical protein
MATTKRTTQKSTRKKPTEDQPVVVIKQDSVTESNIKNILKKLKEIKITAKYCVEQLLYLFVILFAAILIQNMWNFLDAKLMNGQYPITTFEAAVLWICIY